MAELLPLIHLIKGRCEKREIKITFLKFFNLNSHTNDDHNEEHDQTVQDVTQQLCTPIFYNKKNNPLCLYASSCLRSDQYKIIINIIQNYD